MQKPDSLIFDMDGTLWDAVDTYAASWNLVFEELGIDIVVEREELAKMVGMEGRKVIGIIMPDFDDEKRRMIYNLVNEKRKVILPQRGGALYDGVKEGLKQLSEKYDLFILSNCAKGIIRLFIDWAGIDEHIKDELAHGVNFMPKSHNIKLLSDMHGLKNPVYIGDTEGDGQQSRLAGIPFVFVSYGFGKTDDYNLKFDDFKSLTEYFMGL
ncbi:HAD family hydrolase [Mucilaginibacter gotjawali]|uniref:Phosphoglycolate phosphatase n=2 Tax=Mucilaginibacter gotjawali TaxID=1550579 RepID=A0A839SN22_9SPHI|nr:HAD family hydrolase [Mucilaginibacter gotjawali]MBB3059002.1 phosphoglycolate phosphatase [Mucilaginibacter gotjawali]BAU55817.1 bifunctional 5'-methylthioadenosine/S-adenosylhomocysteine nucleosidase/phosphatase [Mucilaginibacter gotjawali]